MTWDILSKVRLGARTGSDQTKISIGLWNACHGLNKDAAGFHFDVEVRIVKSLGDQQSQIAAGYESCRFPRITRSRSFAEASRERVLPPALENAAMSETSIWVESYSSKGTLSLTGKLLDDNLHFKIANRSPY